MATSTKQKPKHGGRRADDAPPDRGCFVSPRCTACPLNRCVLEAPAAELAAFRAAWRTIAKYATPADRTLEP